MVEIVLLGAARREEDLLPAIGRKVQLAVRVLPEWRVRSPAQTRVQPAKQDVHFGYLVRHVSLDLVAPGVGQLAKRVDERRIRRVPSRSLQIVAEARVVHGAL